MYTSHSSKLVPEVAGVGGGVLAVYMTGRSDVFLGGENINLGRDLSRTF